MADSDNNLSVSEKYEDEGLREVYVLVKKPNTTSKVWAHFGLKGDKDGLPDPVEVEKPICRHCHKAIWAKRSNITNLFTHLQDNRPEIYAEVSASKK